QVFEEAEEQGAFIFYNHPGWKHPQGTAEWFEYQTNLLQKGHLYGIEVVNGNDYYPLAHRWCIDKKLAMMGNSDEHNPITFTYDFAKGEHRPMTLVFAKKRTAEAIKEALFARRTAVWWKGGLIGDREFLIPIFRQSIEVVTPQSIITGNGGAYIQIHNDSDIAYEIETTGATEPVSLPKAFVLPAGDTAIVPIRKTAKDVFGRKSVRVPVTVKNLFTEPEKGMADEIEFTVDFQRPAGK
ncbi:MAG: Sb-PDE family phosphodiesterase, partial [Candidatus Latescibacterota bacterium]